MQIGPIPKVRISNVRPPLDPDPGRLHALTGDGLLDPLWLGVLATAVEQEAGEAYRAGFDDGVRTALLRAAPDDGADPAGEGGPVELFLPAAAGEVRP